MMSQLGIRDPDDAMGERKGNEGGGWAMVQSFKKQYPSGTIYFVNLQREVSKDRKASDVWQVASVRCHEAHKEEEWLTCSWTSAEEAVKNYNTEVAFFDKTHAPLTLEKIYSLFKEIHGTSID